MTFQELRLQSRCLGDSRSTAYYLTAPWRSFLLHFPLSRCILLSLVTLPTLCSLCHCLLDMGIRGLWELMQPARVSRPLTAIAVDHQHENGGAPYRIGIDASIWLHQCQTTFAIGHSQSGENPELRLIFFRLARLFRLPIIPLFVFDGPARPALKRGAKVLPLEHWLSQGVRQFIYAFGFEWVTAPAEAEAELARLNARGAIDAVLTDDGDALVFGAKTLIRNPNVKKDKDHVALYTTDALRTDVDSALNLGGLFLIAVLSGGDYDVGLPKCGAETACRLARYGLGDTLLAAVTLPHPDLQSFLQAWVEDLRHYLCNDPQGYLGRRCKAIAAGIPDGFPNPAVLAAYTRPLTTGIYEQPCCVQPTVGKLAQLCEHYFSWGTEAGILDCFRELIWPGIALRVVCPSCLALDSAWTAAVESTGQSSATGNHIAFTLQSIKTVNEVPSYVVRLSPTSFVDCVQSSLCGLRASESSPPAPRKRKRAKEPQDDINVHVPTVLLARAHPDLVQHFEMGHVIKERSTRVKSRTRRFTDSSVSHGGPKADIIDLTV